MLEESPDQGILDSFNKRVPIVSQYLAKDRILGLKSTELAEVVFWCYALMDHIDQFISYKSLGLPEGERISRDEKALTFVKKFLLDKNDYGVGVLEVLKYFIWEDSSPVEERLWNCTSKGSKWKYAKIDKSTLGEIIGLARPEEYPVRNNRISRVLYALGFDVDHF